MIEVFIKNKETPEALVRRYMKKLGDFRRRYARKFFEKPSEKRKEQMQRAALREKHTQKVVLKRSLGVFVDRSKKK